MEYIKSNFGYIIGFLSSPIIIYIIKAIKRTIHKENKRKIIQG